MPNCETCNAPVLFVPSAKSGKSMILDAEPVADGNTIIVDGKAHVASRQFPLPEGQPRYKSHWATCKDAKVWRQRTQEQQT